MKNFLIIIIIFSTILYSKDYREYYENGQKWIEKTYKDGELIKEIRWDEGGNEW